ncbi:hypothetical protein Gpo141_00007350 [Globisporangium polare]
MQRSVGLMRTDLSMMTFRGRTNAIVEIGKRMCQSDDEWKQKCAAMKELRTLLSEYAKKASVHANEEEEENSNSSSSVDESLFTPENIQALTQPFRTTILDLRSTVVKEACEAFATLAASVGVAKSKTIVRDIFPTLLEARGASNKVNTGAVDQCIERIIRTTPSRHILGPVLQSLSGSKNREVRESCIRYVQLALENWTNKAVFEPLNVQLQVAIAASLSDASQRSREIARDCYWKYTSLWPDELEKYVFVQHFAC